MKYFYFILISLLVLSACKKDTNEVEFQNLWDRDKIVSYVQYAEDDVTEVYRDEFEYNDNGLLIGAKSYLDGMLSSRSYNFVYTDNKRTFLMDTYQKSKKILTTNVEEFFLSSDFSTDNLLKRINLINGVETSREEYTTDTKGRENSYKILYFGSLESENNNYRYDGTSQESVLNVYSAGEPVGNRKVVSTFLDDTYMKTKMLSRVQYQGKGNTEYMREEYTYDSMGRENGYKSFYLGNLTNEQKDYVYDDFRKELSFYIYACGDNMSDDCSIRNRVVVVFY